MLLLYGRRHIHLTFPDLPTPPTTNHAYTTFRGKRSLSKRGRSYKADLLSTVSKELLTCPQWPRYREAYFNEGGEIHITLRWYHDIYNAAWTKNPGSKTDKGAMRSPYKRVDISDRLKLVEDALVEATGIDDDGHTRITLEKLPHDGDHIEVVYNLLLWADLHEED